ncbi:MAG: YajQ family cyclic di-GMP-binding protein [Fimbriimonadaceae bacterium]
MAPKDFSFDIVSKVDPQEVRNAVDQAQRELQNRWDLKGTKAEILFEKDEITLIGDDEFRMEQLKDILLSKMIKRGIDIRHIDYSKIEHGTGLTIRQKVELKTGITQDNARPLIKQIKDKGLKVQAQIQGDAIRVTAKDKDELQKTITFVKSLELPMPVAFENYR